MNSLDTHDFKSQQVLSQNIVEKSINDIEMKKSIVQFEFKLLQLYAHKINVILIPKDEDIFEWHGLLTITVGIYSPGKFKFKLSFPPNFPQVRPKIQLLKPLIHPFISQDGVVDVEKLVPNWKYGQQCMLYNVLSKFFDIFIDLSYFDRNDSLNPNASEIYRNNLKEYTNIIQQNIIIHNENLYTDNPNFQLHFKNPKINQRDIQFLIDKVSEVNEESLSFQEKKRKLLEFIFQKQK